MNIQSINYQGTIIQWFQEEETEMRPGSEIKVINHEQYIEKNVFIDFYIKTYCQQWFAPGGEFWRTDNERINCIKKAKEENKITAEREKELISEEKLKGVFHCAHIDFQNFSANQVGPLKYPEIFKNNNLIWDAVQKILLEHASKPVLKKGRISYFIDEIFKSNNLIWEEMLKTTSEPVFKKDRVTYLSKTFIETVLGPAIPDSFLVTNFPNLLRQAAKKRPILAIPALFVSPILIIGEIFYRCIVNVYLTLKITDYRLSGDYANAALLSTRASINSRAPIRIFFSFFYQILTI